MKIKRLFLSALVFCSLTAKAQKTDTVIITPNNINTKVLIPGMHRWLVYFKTGKDSSRTRYQVWSRKIDFLKYLGKDAISITQEWENNDTVIHKAYTVCDKQSFATLFQDSWTKPGGNVSLDFMTKQIKLNGKLIDQTDTLTSNKNRRLSFEKALAEYALDWHLDLEVFPILPYKNNTTFAINFYEPGFSVDPKLMYYTVTGSAVLPGYDGQQIDCWLLEHNDNDRVKNHELFYISKKTKEVVQLEQQYGDRFRYKVKMPFSN